MARAAVNPKVLSTPSSVGLPEVAMLAEDAKTWKQGQLMYLTSGTVTPVAAATGGSAVYGIAAEDQATATSTSTVNILRLVSGTRLEMYVTATAADAAIGVANLGTGYDAYTKSNISYIDTDGTTGAQFQVVGLFVNYQAERATFDAQLTATTPGLCEVLFTEA